MPLLTNLSLFVIFMPENIILWLKVNYSCYFPVASVFVVNLCIELLLYLNFSFFINISNNYQFTECNLCYKHSHIACACHPSAHVCNDGNYL